MPSHLRTSVAIGVVAIVAAGCIASFLIAIQIFPHGDNYLRQKSSSEVELELHRRLSLPDPRTVELRRVVNDYAVANEDVNIIDEIGAPAGVAPDHEELVFDLPPPQRHRPENRPSSSSVNSNTNNSDARRRQQPPVVVGTDHEETTVGSPEMTIPPTGPTVAPYALSNALATVRAFRYTLFFFVYDSRSDEFVIVHNAPGCDHGCHRIYRLASVTAFALRNMFPHRIQRSDRGENDFVVMMSCGDAPRIYARCLNPETRHCGSKAFAPILQFGSVFVDADILPSMIAMPLPVRPHLPCFDEWQTHNFGEGGVCRDLRPKVDFEDLAVRTGLVFGRELGMLRDGEAYWDDLVPQIVWRGTDFIFLTTMFPHMRSPEYRWDIAPREQQLDTTGGSPLDEVDRKRWTIETLWGMGDEKLLPRWRGVLLTSEAELDAQLRAKETGKPTLPWVNIKFASMNQGGQKIPASESPEYQILQNMGISVIGEHINLTEQARYKYHIDLGGGGGTTWTGTIQKLALPGLLFHHVTPTRDWFHDLLVPWTHYVPVNMDLTDLREKFEWAESHPAEAKKIAEAGTEFARWMGSQGGFAQLYERHLVDPLRRVLEAYEPMKSNHPPQYQQLNDKSTLEFITDANEGFTIVGRCSGLHMNSCSKLVVT